MSLPECIGHECHEVSFKTGDLKPERYQIDGDLDALGQQRVYPFPKKGDPIWGLQFIQAEKAAFEQQGQMEMSKFAQPIPSKCEGSGICICALSSDPKDRTTVVTRVSVQASYTFPDRTGTATIFGSFQLETIRTKGLCTIGSRAELLVNIPDKFALAFARELGLSQLAIEVLSGKPETERV